MSAKGHEPGRWERAIVFVDMDAFFAAIEQRDDPGLAGRPVGITNGEQGSCIITCSYEARACGVHTGMRLAEARHLCPELIRVPARPERYAEVSTAIMQALRDISPDLEVFSVDEAFLDVTRCQRLHGSPERMGRMAQERVREVSGLSCTVGVAGDKTTAKYAAETAKPKGFACIPPELARERLRDVPVTALSGIGPGIGAFLARHGARTCGEAARLPVSVLAARFGNLGRRIWYMCQGADPEPVRPRTVPPQSLGHGKVVEPARRRDGAALRVYLHHMGEKVAARLRYNGLAAQRFLIGLLTADGWQGGEYVAVQPVQDGRSISGLCDACLEEHWRGAGVSQVQVTALAPLPAGMQPDLFEPAPVSRTAGALEAVMDRINRRYGEFTLAPVRLLERSKAPNVIAPAWKPDGVRRHI